MKKSVRRSPLHWLRKGARKAVASLPASVRFAWYRRMVDCEPLQDPGFEVKIAETQDELEASFALLHDAYVDSGFMQRHPSGLRVTPYHALPTTTTICAKLDGRVVGTLSMVREGVFGFPLQSAFDIGSVRAKEGRIAEISSLAVHPDFRRTGGKILYPLMKYMREYCTRYFDTRHIVIAVHPTRIEMYEALLCFERLTANIVDKYDFANGAPAVGATLDLIEAAKHLEPAYRKLSERQNLYRYLWHAELPQLKFPDRQWHTSNDPVLTPSLVDYFFNQRTQGFAGFDHRRKRLLHSIYTGPEWESILPGMDDVTDFGGGLRRNPRFTFKCPARLVPADGDGAPQEITIVEISNLGFQARVSRPLARGQRFTVLAELGAGIRARVQAMAVRVVAREGEQLFGCSVVQPDEAWHSCLAWLEGA